MKINGKACTGGFGRGIRDGTRVEGSFYLKSQSVEEAFIDCTAEEAETLAAELIQAAAGARKARGYFPSETKLCVTQLKKMDRATS